MKKICIIILGSGTLSLHQLYERKAIREQGYTKNSEGEEPIDEDLPIVDPHFYLWLTSQPERFNYKFLKQYGWLKSKYLDFLAFKYFKVSAQKASCMKPMMYDYEIAKFQKDIRGQKIVKGINIEYGWRGDRVKESKWVVSTQQPDTLPFSHLKKVYKVGDGRFGSDLKLLDQELQMQKDMGVVGVRELLFDKQEQQVPFDQKDSQWSKGFALLDKYHLVFDAALHYNQLPRLKNLAQNHPKVKIIVNHCGFLKGGPVDKEQMIKDWKIYMKELAKYKNVYVKLSFCAVAFGYDKWKVGPSSDQIAKDYAPIILFLIETFGVDRCMFASNFPVNKVAVNYSNLYNGFKKIVKHKTLEEKLKLFHDNAIKVYNLK